MNESIHAEALQVIQQLYGEDASFREGQYEAIEATLTHRRTLVIQKTGWGKSLVYFVCTKLQRNAGRGMTIVVSPLLVLMENQIQSAQQLGLQCAVINSSTKEQHEEYLAAMRNGALDLVLITPETLFTEKVQTALQQVQIGLFVIDEAHCISDWGHDFRLEYTRLNKIIRQMPYTVPILGTTATANDRVIADLKEQFGEDVFVSRGELMRRSLSIQILHLSTPAERYAWILENVPQLSGSGIIYCLTQRDCEHLAGFLQENGITARAYHSGMEQNDTEHAENLLRTNQIKVLVATVKLGMGYDKGDIAFVIHYQQPSNIVAYYQQIGRAGRNIDRACTFLMCGEEDRNIQNYFIETAFPSEAEARSIYDIVFSCAESGISQKGIQNQINIRANRIEKALMFLRNEEFIVKEDSRYYPTLHSFQYNREHYDAVTQIRRQEQQQMAELIGTTQCLSRFIVNQLDDPTTENCGICRNCLGYPEFPESPSQPFIECALAYIERLQIPIVSRKKWADTSFTGSIRIATPNAEGICLSKYGDPGYGTLVKNGKYGNSEFCEELIGKSASVLRTIIAERGITAITCVPSLRSRIVEKFAVSLAERCRIPFVPMLKKHGRIQQKAMQNSLYQCRNAWNSFSLLDDIEDIPTRIILVDDIIDSKWTMTVCGYLLTTAGCEMVFPFALADSSENRRDQE